MNTRLQPELDHLEARAVALYGIAEAVARRQRERLAVAGGEIHLDVYSPEGEQFGTVVFVGGLSSHALMYAGFLDALSQRGYAVVALDLRGHGRSSGERGDFSIESVIEDLTAAAGYARERFGGAVTVLGSSLGGFFALVGANAIRGFDAGISHGVLLPELPISAKDRRLAPLARLLARLAPRLRLSTRLLTDWSGVAESPELRAAIQSDPLMAWRYTTRAIASGSSYRPARPLTDLRVPHLLIVGEHDRMTPLDYARQVYARMSGPKELAVVPDAGHMGGLVEHRDEMLALVDAFLRRVAGEGSQREEP
ncbi:MAG TPA: alpha/beta fold hydrolase [Thermomicrobiaceae bacterium]|nr:alpha/beta fold hydrolase [Thermomicrobiaceae bacterium]